MLSKLARRLCWRPSFPISADDDVADEEAEQDEPVGVQQTLVEPKGAHAADHLRKRDMLSFNALRLRHQALTNTVNSAKLRVAVWMRDLPVH